MSALTWDGTGERKYKTGVDKGVYYPVTTGGSYGTGVAWNGLISVAKNPSGAEASKFYADNILYAVLYSTEEFGATITCYTYPDEANPSFGKTAAADGVYVGQQDRTQFGFVYREKIGNDTEGTSHGYELNLLYGLYASPSEETANTISDSPELEELSYEVTSTPVTVGDNFKPTSCVTIDSTTCDATKLAALEAKLFGSESAEPTLPSPAEVIAMLKA